MNEGRRPKPMKIGSRSIDQTKAQRGMAAIMVAIILVVLIGFAALAVDVFHLFVARNELQNAADAGALAGARVLYKADGTVNEGANQVAYEAAIANKSEKVAVEVNWSGGNEGDLQRGHWSFKDRKFTPNASLDPVQLWNVSNDELDANLNFINALRVVVRRKDTPVASFFARIFGFEKFILSAEAVAYIGFAGDLFQPDQPIAICQQAILDQNGQYTCGVGRMLNSGNGNDGHQTGAWTNFSQPCDPPSASQLAPLVCASGNSMIHISLGEVGTYPGTVTGKGFDNLRDCWMKNKELDGDGDKIPDRPWSMTLAVIDCPGNNTSNCSKILGAVTVDIVWITRQDKNQYKEVPRKMYNPQKESFWICPPAKSGKECWDSFVNEFQLRDVLNASPAIYEDKTIYFLPSCQKHEPTGRTGGKNFGVLAKIPVLVK